MDNIKVERSDGSPMERRGHTTDKDELHAVLNKRFEDINKSNVGGLRHGL